MANTLIIYISKKNKELANKAMVLPEPEKYFNVKEPISKLWMTACGVDCSSVATQRSIGSYGDILFSESRTMRMASHLTQKISSHP